MIQGKNLKDLAIEVMRQDANKQDMLVDPGIMAMEFMGHEGAQGPHLRLGDNGGSLPLGPVAHDQLGSWLGIPRPYYQRMLAEDPRLLTENVNTWLPRQEGRRLVRTLDGRARAILSNAYRPLDNLPVMHAVLEGAKSHQLIVQSCEITERRLYLQLVSPALEAEVKVGQPVQAGLLVTNSEVGLGMVKLELLLYILRCTNGMIVGEGLKRRHVGRRLAGDDGVPIDYQLDTLMADQKAFQLQIRDNIAGLLTDERFNAVVDRMKGAVAREIPAAAVKPAVENVTRRFNLTTTEGDSALANIIAGGDLNAWGLSNAVTRIANRTEDYERGIELERIGGQIIDLPAGEWREILKEAA